MNPARSPITAAAVLTLTLLAGCKNGRLATYADRHPGESPTGTPGSPSSNLKLSSHDEQMRLKLAPVIDCINQTFPHFEDIAKPYHEEIAARSAHQELPFYSRPFGGYFKSSTMSVMGNYKADCADGLDKAASQSPSVSDLDTPAKDAASALRALGEPGKQFDSYLEQKGYLDDGFAKGRQLDATLSPLLARILNDGDQLRTASQREDHTIRLHELDAIDKAEGHSMRWHNQQLMLLSRSSNDQLESLWIKGQLDPASCQSAIQPLQAAFDETQAFVTAHPANPNPSVTDKPRQIWTSIESSLTRQLADERELRQNLEGRPPADPRFYTYSTRPPETPAERHNRIVEKLKSVNSSFNNVVSSYNSAVSY